MTRYNKYQNQKTEVDGITFASQMEANRYIELKLLEQADTIDSLKLQPEFQISQGWVNPKSGEKIRSRFYVGDFMYHDKMFERVVVEDVKGMETPEFRLKWDLVRSQYPQYMFVKVTKDDI